MKEFFSFINFFIAPIIVPKEELKSRSFKIFMDFMLLILIMLINVFTISKKEKVENMYI